MKNFKLNFKEFYFIIKYIHILKFSIFPIENSYCSHGPHKGKRLF